MKTMSKVYLLALLLSAGCTFTSCDLSKGNGNNHSSSYTSSNLVGEWVESSEDDYLVGHYQFYSNGTGKFWLTDGNTNRGGFSFSWEQDGMYVRTYANGSCEELTYSDGVLAHAGAGGASIYHKR